MLVFWFGLGGLLVSVIGLEYLDSNSSMSQWTIKTWGLVMSQSVLGLAGVYFMYKAISFTSPTRVMIIRSFEIVFSYILQVLLTYLFKVDNQGVMK